MVWRDNLMTTNPDKCHLLLSTKEKVAGNVNDLRIENSNHEFILIIKLQLTIICQRCVKKPVERYMLLLG